MYRSVRNGSSENARTDSDLHFAMRTLNPTHSSSQAAFDDELRSRDILNCDLQEESEKLEKELRRDELKHATRMSRLKGENWELGEQLRELEKKNALFTAALRQGPGSPGDVNESGMNCNVDDGPEPQTKLLHEAIQSMQPSSESFVRIVPPQPHYEFGNIKYDSSSVTAKVSRLRRPASAKPPVSHSERTAGTHVSRPGSAPLVRGTESSQQHSAVSGRRSVELGDVPMTRSRAPSPTMNLNPTNETAARPTTASSDKLRRGSFDCGWLGTFSEIVDSYVRSNEQQMASMSSRTEYMKRRALVHKEVEKLVCGLPATSSFHDAVDALDHKTRAGLLDEVATEMTALGIFARAVHSMRRIAESSFDMDQCFELFTREVKELVGAEHVRLWLVDETNAQIWEWSAADRAPAKRSFWASESPVDEHNMFTRKRTTVKAGIAADVARTGIPINVPFPAVQSQSFSIEIDRLPGENARTIVCEPIRHEGSIVAVTQCYNKKGDSEEAPFTVLDELVLRQLSEHVGGLWRKCVTYDQTMAISEQTLNAMELSNSFPCDTRDLYSLAQVHLSQTRDLVRAGHCVLYVYSPAAFPSQPKIWCMRADGSGERLEFEVGEGAAGWVALHREALLVDDPGSDPRFDLEVDAAFSGWDESGAPHDDFAARNLLAVPVDNLDGSLLGVCVLLNKASGPFHQTDAQLLEIRCQQVAHMVKTNTADHSHFFVSETVRGVLDRCKLLTAADRALFFLVDKQHKLLRLVADASQDAVPWEGGEAAVEVKLSVPLSDGLLGYVARVGIGICVPDAQLDPRFSPDLDKTLQYRTTSLLCLPVVDPDHDALMLGVTLISNKAGGSAFTEQDRVIANALSRQLAKLYAAKTAHLTDIPARQRRESMAT